MVEKVYEKMFATSAAIASRSQEYQIPRAQVEAMILYVTAIMSERRWHKLENITASIVSSCGCSDAACSTILATDWHVVKS